MGAVIATATRRAQPDCSVGAGRHESQVPESMRKPRWLGSYLKYPIDALERLVYLTS